MTREMEKQAPGQGVDPYLYSHESVFAQLKSAAYELGYYRLHFYTQGGNLSKTPTDTISPFYLYPSGGTLRDESMNIVLYDSKYDLYRGFQPPIPSDR